MNWRNPVRRNVLIGCAFWECICFGQNLGYRFSGGMYRSAVKSVSGDSLTKSQFEDELVHSPEMIGYALGASLYYQLSSLPIYIGGYIKESSVKGPNPQMELKSLSQGIEFGAWYPHPLLQPYLLVGFGIMGSSSIRSEYQLNKIYSDYIISPKKADFHQGFGIRMPSNPQLSASIQWEFGYEYLRGKIFRKEEDKSYFINSDFNQGQEKQDISLMARNHAFLIGIDYLTK
jgi:hypothetical protein